jgi:hypothetical protein
VIQELLLLKKLAEESQPLPKGTKKTDQSRFYELARKHVAHLVDETIAMQRVRAAVQHTKEDPGG